MTTHETIPADETRTVLPAAGEAIASVSDDGLVVASLPDGERREYQIPLEEVPRWRRFCTRESPAKRV